MHPMKSGKPTLAKRRAWHPPQARKLAIGAETRAATERAGLNSSSQPQFAQPEPPVAPKTKLGFSVEWAFPLSARWES